MPDKAAPPGRVIFVNRFFFPDKSATSQILSDVAFHLASTGRRVDVICARLTYDTAQSLAKSEIVSGVRIQRVATTRFGRANLIARTSDYLSFYFSASWQVLRQARRGDILVIKTDPPLLSVPLALIARHKKIRRVNWLQDLYPEVAAELGVSLAGGLLGRFLRGLRNRSLRGATVNVAIGRQMKAHLETQAIPADRIEIIGNFVDDEAIQPVKDRSGALRRAWGFSDQDFIIGYSGNLGRAHDIDTMLEASEHLAGRSDIKFLFIGGGHLHARLREEAGRRNLSNIFLRPYQPREVLSQSLGLPDLHWVSLQPALEGLIVPSKIYGIAAAGRPVVMIGSPAGEIGRMLDTNEFGLTIMPGHADALAQAISGLSDDRPRIGAMGRAARRFIDQHASRAHAFNAWQKLLERVDGD